MRLSMAAAAPASAAHPAIWIAKTLAVRIAEAPRLMQAGPRQHDRHAAGRLLQRVHSRVAEGQNDVRYEDDQFSRDPAIVLDIAGPPTVVDTHVLPVDPPQLRLALHKRSNRGHSFGICHSGHEYADAPDPLTLLRVRCQRPPCR